MRPAELKNIAIYHASFQVVKRSAGRSAVAASAYRSGERLVDERTGEIHDYTRKGGVDDAFILAPDDAPSWATDRNALWSAVELGEVRKDAQLARELNVALPRELSQSESTELLKTFVTESFVDKGMVADVALHHLDSDNPHAHVMLTMRSISQDGFGQKNRDWNKKDQLVEWRESWEKAVNRQLELSGHDVRIDHRSLKDQGLDRVPSVHMGVHVSQMEKRGIATFKGDLNRQVAKINTAIRLVGEKIEERIKAVQLVIQNTGKSRDAILEHVSRNGSVLKSALDQNKAEQVKERQRKQQERSLKRSGPSLEL